MNNKNGADDTKKEKKNSDKNKKRTEVIISPDLTMENVSVAILDSPVPMKEHSIIVRALKESADYNTAVGLYFLKDEENYLMHEHKVGFSRRAFGSVVQRETVSGIRNFVRGLCENHKSVNLIIEFKNQLKIREEISRHDNIKVRTIKNIHSVNEEDLANRLEEILPRSLQERVEQMGILHEINVKMQEELNDESIINEVLDVAQRRKRAIVMKRNKKKIALARKRASKRPASMEKLKKRARKTALNTVKKKLLGGKSLSDLSMSQKRNIEKRVASKAAMVSKIAKRILPTVKKKDRAKLSKKPTTEEKSFHVKKNLTKIDENVLFDCIDLVLLEQKIDIPKPSETLGIPRDKMPQIRSTDHKDFEKYMTSKGIGFEDKDVSARSMKASQREFSTAGVLKAMEKWDTKAMPRIIASSDGYIIDGHHRWLGAKNKNEKIAIREYDVDAKKLLFLARAYPKSYTKAIYENISKDREEGTDSLLKIYKKSTPGEKNKDV